ncbi:MAG: AAA family ATPase [Candidatus Wukongarchaeota archaeon]|nr:AAA family ATPase [Candidatus Wukongarchaeota archaeon]
MVGEKVLSGRKKGKVLAVSGKGGVGKTTFLALVLKTLIDTSKKDASKKYDILVADADPDANMADILGVEVPASVGDISMKMKENMHRIPLGISKDRYLEGLIFQILSEEHDFDLIEMGSVERGGCYCSLNSLLTRILDTLSENYDISLADMPAGLEHVNRRTQRDIDILYLITDGTKPGLKTIKRILEIAKKVKVNFKNVYIVGNKVSEKIEASLKKYAEENKLSYAGSLPYDSKVMEFSLDGENLLDIPEDSPAYSAVKSIVEKTVKSAGIEI